MSGNSMDFTTGSIPKSLFGFSLPFFLTNLVQSLYNMADIMVISRFCGKEGIAGASIGGNVIMTVTFIIIGLCNGSGHTVFTMIPSIFSSVIARIPVAYFCTRSLGLGLAGVGISTPTGTISAIIICTVYYLSGKWKRKTI